MANAQTVSITPRDIPGIFIYPNSEDRIHAMDAFMRSGGMLRDLGLRKLPRRDKAVHTLIESKRLRIGFEGIEWSLTLVFDEAVDEEWREQVLSTGGLLLVLAFGDEKACIEAMQNGPMKAEGNFLTVSSYASLVYA